MTWSNAEKPERDPAVTRPPADTEDVASKSPAIETLDPNEATELVEIEPEQEASEATENDPETTVAVEVERVERTAKLSVTEHALPKRAGPTMEQEDPNKPIDAVDIPWPKRHEPLEDIIDPVVMIGDPSTERLPPNAARLRTDKDEPKAPEQRKEKLDPT